MIQRRNFRFQCAGRLLIDSVIAAEGVGNRLGKRRRFDGDLSL